MSIEAMEGQIRSGGMYFSPVHRRYVDSVDKPLQEIIVEPHIIGLTRELAMTRFGTWIGFLSTGRHSSVSALASSACCSLR